VEAFLAVLKSVTKEEPVQYVLALLLQMLAGKRLAILVMATTQFGITDSQRTQLGPASSTRLTSRGQTRIPSSQGAR
jgi:hypothetical protein